MLDRGCVATAEERTGERIASSQIMAAEQFDERSFRFRLRSDLQIRFDPVTGSQQHAAAHAGQMLEIPGQMRQVFRSDGETRADREVSCPVVVTDDHQLVARRE